MKEKNSRQEEKWESNVYWNDIPLSFPTFTEKGKRISYNNNNSFTQSGLETYFSTPKHRCSYKSTHTHNIFKVISPLHSTSFTLCMHTNFTHLYMQSAGIRFSYNDSGQIVESWCPFSPWDKFIANSQTSINVIIRWWNWGGKTDALYMPIHNGAGNGNVEKCKCCNSGGDGTVPRRREKREERKERWNAFGMARWLRTCSGYNMKNESWKRMFSHLLTRVNKMTLLSNWTSNIHKRLYGKAYGMMVFFSALEWAIGFKPRSKIYMHIIYFHESRKGFGMMLIEWHMWI